MRTGQKPRKDQGATLIVSIIACALFLGFLMSALFQSASLGASGSTKAIADRQARYAAYAGIQRSFVELEKNPAWRAGWPTPQPLVLNPTIGYTVDADDRPPGLGSDEVYLFSQGYPEMASGAKAIAAYGGTAYRPSKIFTEAGFGYTSLLLSGSSTTNAYDSNIGYKDADATEEGSVGSTGTITVDNATVKGDAILAKAFVHANTDPTAPPPAALPAELILNGTGSITGDEVEPPEARVSVSFEKPYDDNPTEVITDMDALIPAGAPDGTPPTLSPGSYKSISVPPGKKLKLTDGEYYISESLLVDGAELIIPDNAKVRVFIGGDMSVKNAKINPPDYDNGNMTNKLRPEEFCLFFLDERRDPVTDEALPSAFSSDNSLLNCAIAGRELQANLDNGTTLYGAVSGGSVTIKDSTLHYDKSLKDADMSDYTGWRLRGLSAEPPRSSP